MTLHRRTWLECDHCKDEVIVEGVQSAKDLYQLAIQQGWKLTTAQHFCSMCRAS